MVHVILKLFTMTFFKLTEYATVKSFTSEEFGSVYHYKNWSDFMPWSLSRGVVLNTHGSTARHVAEYSSKDFEQTKCEP